MPSPTPEDAILRWMDRPDIMVRELFDATPDPWQDETLKMFPHEPRLAMKAAKGPGKTTTLAWCAWNFLLTRPFPNGAATSISGANLYDGLWKEMAHWRARSKLLQAVFDITSERVFHREYPGRWFLSARTWSKSADALTLGNTLAGLHSDYVLFILDECGSMPVAILQSAEGALANAAVGSGKEAHIVIAGNTNTLEGALYHACVKHAKLWKVVVINGDPDNPLRSPRISIEWARQLIEQYGRDNPFVKVTVLGEWPAASVNALIGPDEIEAAMKRAYREFQYGQAAKVMGLDVAREGDDKSVLFPRQGIVAFPPKVWRNVNSLQGAGAVSRFWGEWDADACFVDMTGGFGTGWYDQLVSLGRAPLGVHYAGEPHDKTRYFNKRAEMYFDLVEWIKMGGQLPPLPELTQALTQTTYSFKGDKFIIEPKEIIKKKIGFSPDDADALAQTFAEPVQPKKRTVAGERNRNVMDDYDPFAAIYENMKQ